MESGASLSRVSKVPSVHRVCQSAKQANVLGPVDGGCCPVPKRGANFNVCWAGWEPAAAFSRGEAPTVCVPLDTRRATWPRSLHGAPVSTDGMRRSMRESWERERGRQAALATPIRRRSVPGWVTSALKRGARARLSPQRRRSTPARPPVAPMAVRSRKKNIADAGSIPATSTTTGVHGFDGMQTCDGQLAMVPAVSGSAESGVRCDGPNSQTPMTAFIRLRWQLDVPAARNGTQERHLSRSRPSAGIFISVAE